MIAMREKGFLGGRRNETVKLGRKFIVDGIRSLPLRSKFVAVCLRALIVKEQHLGSDWVEQR